MCPCHDRFPNVISRLKLFTATCVALLTLAGCGDRDHEITLAELAANQQAYDGLLVRARGTVKGFHDPRHYWLEDEHVNRVGLMPPERIAPHLGREVSIVGRYSYARNRGRRITIIEIEAFDPTR